jgi:hypothetical protein
MERRIIVGDCNLVRVGSLPTARLQIEKCNRPICNVSNEQFAIAREAETPSDARCYGLEIDPVRGLQSLPKLLSVNDLRRADDFFPPRLNNLPPRRI